MPAILINDYKPLIDLFDQIIPKQYTDEEITLVQAMA